MGKLCGLFALGAMAGGLGYFLYLNGFLVINAKTALLYIGSPPVRNETEFHKSEIFILQRSRQKGDLPSEGGALFVHLFVEHDKRDGFC